MWLLLGLACGSPAKKKESVSPAIASPSSDSTEESDLCDVATLGGDCLDQKISVVGNVPTMVMNHPMVNSPSGADSVQAYIDVEQGQWIVLSSERHSCENQMKVVGILKKIDLGGAPGTRSSYGNYVISNSVITCLP